MKKGLIVFLVFALVLVIGLLITGVFSKTQLHDLSVKTTNTTVVVKDSDGEVVANNATSLEAGETYTITITPYEDCILQYLTINDTNYFKKLENNQCTFVCNGATIIKAISVVDSALEEPPVTGITQVYSATYKACTVMSPGVSKVDNVTLILYDSTGSIVARLGVGETFNLLVENEKYTVRYSSESAYKNVRVTNTAIDFKYHSFPYTFTAKANANLNITSFNSVIFDIIPNSVLNVGEQEQTGEFVAGESYTLNDNAPEGFKTNLYVNNQLVQLPYTFTYTEDMTFDFELVEEEVEYTTITYQFSNIESITLSKRDGTGEEIHLDVSTGTATAELELGVDYTFRIFANTDYEISSLTYNLNEFLTEPTSSVGGIFTVTENGVFQIITHASQTIVTPTINGEGFTTTFTNSSGVETNILVLGQTYTVTFAANEGYLITDATFNGNWFDITQPYTFTVTEELLFAVNCFEICDPVVEFNIPNATCVVYNGGTDVTDSAPYTVGTEYSIRITANEGYLLQDISFAGWEDLTGAYTSSHVALGYDVYNSGWTATQTKLIITGTTVATVETPTIESNNCSTAWYTTNAAKTSVFAVGNDYYLQIICDNSYEIEKVVFNNEELQVETHSTLGQVVLWTAAETNHFVIKTIYSPYDNLTVQAENCDVKIYRLISGDNYQEVFTIPYNQIRYIYAMPHEGYEIVSATLNGVELSNFAEKASGPPYYSYNFKNDNVLIIVTQPITETTITPAVTINGYNADFANIGVIKYRTDYSSPNYIYDNLTFGESYYIQVDIFANASTDYYISAIYVNGTLLGSGDSTTSTLEVGRFEVTNPLNIVVEIGSK